MNEQKNIGKGFLKEKLGDYQVNPPESVWNSIASQIGGRSRRAIIIFSLSAAATIALALTLGINYFGPKLPKGSGLTEIPESGIIEERLSEIEPNQEEETKSGLEKPRQSLEDKVINVLEELEDAPIELTEDSNLEIVLEKEDQKENFSNVLVQDLKVNQILDSEPEDAIEQVNEPDPKVEEEKSTEVVENLEIEENMEIEENFEVDENIAPPVDLLADPLDQNEEILSEMIPEALEEKNADPRWMIGAVLSPLYSFRDAEASAMSSAAEYESGLVSYAGGIHVSYRTASRLAIESGLFYNKMGISIGAPGIQLFNKSYAFAPLDATATGASNVRVSAITNSVGNIVAKSGEVYVNNYLLNSANESNVFFDLEQTDAINADEGIRQHLDYLELPFNLRYTVIDRAIELQLVGGMSTNFLVNNYVTMESSMGTTEIGYLTNIRSVNYSGNAGIGMIYHLHERFSLRLEPRFRYFLNSVNDATLPSTRPYAFGLFTGLSYIF